MLCGHRSPANAVPQLTRTVAVRSPLRAAPWRFTDVAGLLGQQPDKLATEERCLAYPLNREPTLIEAMHRNDVQTGADLNTYREFHGLTREDFASLIGITSETLRKWTRKPNLRNHRPWIPTLLLGVEHRLRARRTSQRSRDRAKQAKALTHTIPVRAALERLPPTISHLFTE